MAKAVLGLGSAKARFEDGEAETDLGSETLIERLRYFCSLTMVDRDWFDVKPFFDAIVAERADATRWLARHRYSTRQSYNTRMKECC